MGEMSNGDRRGGVFVAWVRDEKQMILTSPSQSIIRVDPPSTVSDGPNQEHQVDHGEHGLGNADVEKSTVVGLQVEQHDVRHFQTLNLYRYMTVQA